MGMERQKLRIGLDILSKQKQEVASVINHGQNRGMIWDDPKAKGVAFRSLTGCAS